MFGTMVQFVVALLLSYGMASATVTLPCSGSETEAEAACKALAEGGHGVAVCGGLIHADVKAEAKAVCGKALAECENGDVFLKLSLVEDACSQAQSMSAAATLMAGDTSVACGDTSQICGDTAQVCGDVALSCPAAPECPDIQPACARWSYKYKKSGVLKSQRCLRWVIPVVDLQ